MMYDFRLDRFHPWQIANSVVERRFAKQEKELIEREHALALDLYNEMLSPETREVINNLPSSWFYHTDFIRVDVDKEGKDYAAMDLKLGTKLPIPLCINTVRMMRCDYRSSLGIRCLEIALDKDEHHEEVEKYRKELTQDLKGVTSAAHLRQVWPEIAQLEELKHWFRPEPSTPCDVDFSKYNKDLGLK